MKRLLGVAPTHVEAIIKVDPGDRSTGVPEHWHEDTSVAIITQLPGEQWINGATFEPEIEKPVREWRVTQAWTAHKPDGGRTISLVDVENPTTWRQGETGLVPQLVGDLPDPMIVAICVEWGHFRERLREEELAEEQWEREALNHERGIIDLDGPEGGRYWLVTTEHEPEHPDAHAAAVQARATGSVGATYNDATVTAYVPGGTDKLEMVIGFLRKHGEHLLGDDPDSYMLSRYDFLLLEAGIKPQSAEAGALWRQHGPVAS